MVNGFVSAIFIKTINCVGEPLDRHLKSHDLLFDVIVNVMDLMKKKLL